MHSQPSGHAARPPKTNRPRANALEEGHQTFLRGPLRSQLIVIPAGLKTAQRRMLQKDAHQTTRRPETEQFTGAIDALKLFLYARGDVCIHSRQAMPQDHQKRTVPEQL